MQQRALYIFIKNPKTARFARRQRARIDDDSLIFLIRCVFGGLPLSAFLFPASQAVFRRQWNGLFDHLGILRRQSEHGATPGVLRGSGATNEYLESSNISQTQWKGRWSRLRTLEYYIQEVAAQLFLFSLKLRPGKTWHGHLSKCGKRAGDIYIYICFSSKKVLMMQLAPGSTIQTSKSTQDGPPCACNKI